MQHDNQRVEPEMKQDKIGALASFDVVLKVGGVEVELGGQSLVYTWEEAEMLAPFK